MNSKNEVKKTENNDKSKHNMKSELHPSWTAKKESKQ